ncbi:MAG: copper-binding protein [Myxococcales bacterium]
MTRLGAILFAALLFTGCREPRDAPASPAAAPPAAASGDRYTVRGELVRITRNDASAPPQLTIRHEAIPDFKDADGKVVGMEAMVMPFPLAPGASAEGLSPGDKVRFRFVMDWATNRYQVEQLEKLPPDAELKFATPGEETAPKPAE